MKFTKMIIAMVMIVVGALAVSTLSVNDVPEQVESAAAIVLADEAVAEAAVGNCSFGRWGKIGWSHCGFAWSGPSQHRVRIYCAGHGRYEYGEWAGPYSYSVETCNDGTTPQFITIQFS